MLAFVFPGQGSQKKGMGQGLFDDVAEYRAVESQVDALLGYSMRQLCLEDANDQLKETQFTQPSLYVANALHYYKALSEGQKPAFVAGHSLGEYNALLAAGAFDFLTGLKLVQKRGQLMSQAKNGGMAAVIGLDAAAIPKLLADNELGALDIANYNSPAQTVLSGPKDDILRAQPIFQTAGAKLYVPLAVSAAFHSRYVSDAAKAFDEFLSGFTFSALQIPVIANVTGQPYPTDNPTQSIRSALVKQITGSVYWTQSVRYLMNAGVTEFKEMGPGNVLTKLMKQIQA
jgi:malonyl CoA-acyl carrier protein transacylase